MGRRVILGVVFLAWSVVPSAAAPVLPATTVLYVFDVSGSFHTRRADSPLVRSARQLPRLVKTLTSTLRHPQRHTVTTIGDLSYDDPLCSVAPSQSPFSRRQEDLEQTLKKCVARLERHPPSPTTDISGALDLASRLLQRTDEPTHRALVLFTDLVETRAAETPEPAQPKLDGVCVAIVWAYTSALRKDPKAVDRYIEDLRKKLTQAQVRAVHFELLTNEVAPTVSQFLKDCRERP